MVKEIEKMNENPDFKPTATAEQKAFYKAIARIHNMTANTLAQKVLSMLGRYSTYRVTVGETEFPRAIKPLESHPEGAILQKLVDMGFCTLRQSDFGTYSIEANYSKVMVKN